MSLMNKVAVVTGAGSGLGRSIAAQFAKYKIKLALIDKNDVGLEETVEICKQNGAKVNKFVLDLTRDNDVKKTVNDIFKEFERIDILINCAGVQSLGNILSDNIMNVFDKIIPVNIRAMVCLTHECAPHLIASKGCIVNISSITSEFVVENMMVYGISKAAVAYFTKAVAFDLAKEGVRTNAVAPGLVKTNILVNAGKTKEEDDAYWEREKYNTIDPEEVADLVVYLVSDKAKSINGVQYVVDKGALVFLGN